MSPISKLGIRHTQVGQDNSAIPALAESWEVNDDATVWRFKLRKGVEFSDGKSLTTDDVVDSINVHRGDESKFGAKGVFSGITDVKGEGKNIVAVTLGDPNANFPFLMTDYHMNVVPSLGGGKADVTSPIGTGLYTLDSFDPGVRATLKRNPNAWQQSDTMGNVDTVEVVIILDDTARQNALLGGSVDVINRPVLKTIKRLEQTPGIAVQAVESNLAFTHPMHADTAPFDNNDFRMALKHALPRESFVSKVLHGYGTLGNDQPLGPSFESWDPSIHNEYDLDKARHYLKKAGMEGTSFQMYTADAAYSGAVDAAQLFQEEFAKIGLDMEVIRKPNDGYWTDVWTKKPFVSCYWGPRPIEDMILSIAYIAGATWNDSHIDIPRVHELVVKARGELDADKRNVMYREVATLIAKEGSTLVPAFGQDVSASNKTKIGVPDRLGGGWEMDGGHFIKRWWVKV